MTWPIIELAIAVLNISVFDKLELIFNANSSLTE